MNTKEAVEFSETIKFRLSHLEETQLKQIIELLKRGEKYEAMWGEFEIYIEGKSEALKNKMNILWQKYIIEEGGK